MRHHCVGQNRHSNVWRCMSTAVAVAATAAWWAAAVLLLLLVPVVSSELYSRHLSVGHCNQQRMQPAGHDRWYAYALKRRNLNDKHALWELTPRGGASFEEYAAAPVPVPSSSNVAMGDAEEAGEDELDDGLDIENDTGINAEEYSYNDDVYEDEMIENNRNMASMEEEADDDDDEADIEWVEEEEEEQSTARTTATADDTVFPAATESGEMASEDAYDTASWNDGEEEDDEDDHDNIAAAAAAAAGDGVEDDIDAAAQNVQIELTGVVSDNDGSGSFFSGDAAVEEDADSVHSTSENQGGDDDPEGGDDDDDDGSHSDEASAASFTTQVLLDNPAIDENDSASYVDRLDLADDYDNEDVVASASLDLADSDIVGATTTTGSDDELPAVSTPAPTESINKSDDIVVEDSIMAPEVTVMTTSSLTTEDDTPSEQIESIATFTDHHSSGLTEIDDETRHILMKELNYRRREIDAMKPDVAVLVAANKLHRPEEGIPTNWRKAADETKRQPPGWLTSLRQHQAFKLLPKVAGIAIVGSLAVIKGPEIALGLLKSAAPQRKLLGVPGKMSPTAKTTTTLTPPDATDNDEVLDPFAAPDAQGTVTEPTSSDTVPAKEGGGGLMESHTKSVKPGAGRPNYDDLDVTWLDKLITAVERRIKAFLQLEI